MKYRFAFFFRVLRVPTRSRDITWNAVVDNEGQTTSLSLEVFKKWNAVRCRHADRLEGSKPDSV